MVQMKNNDEPITTKSNDGDISSRVVRVFSEDILKFTNKKNNTSSFKSLDLSLKRLMGTVISTNITETDEHDIEYFHLIESAGIKRKNDTPNGKIIYLDVKISDWMRKSIENNQILTLHRDYFRLPKPIDKGLYEIARRHCGRKKQWSISVKKLYKKIGTRGKLTDFRISLKSLEKRDLASEYVYFPDYKIEFNTDKDMVTFHNKKAWWNENKDQQELPEFSPSTYEIAKEVAPSFNSDDIYSLVPEFEKWWFITKNSPSLDKNVIEKAFIGFCKGREKDANAKKAGQSELFNK